MLDLIKQYEAEKKKWIEAGKPMRSKEEMARIHNICSGCPLFEKKKGWVPGYDKCGVCQCNLHKSANALNKIAWATTKCPKEDPEWVAEVDGEGSVSKDEDV